MFKHAIRQIVSGWLSASPKRVRGTPRRKEALFLSVTNPTELLLAAQLLSKGRVGVVAFNGIYGIFTNAASHASGKRILAIKNRPSEKKLVLVTAPEYLAEQVDFSQAHYTHAQVVALVRSLHALGVILPAHHNAPRHLLAAKETQQTILSIWTEYPPLRSLLETYRNLGGHALSGTSANRSGHPTHTATDEVWQEFKTAVDFFLAADFTHLPAQRKQSTSILDLTTARPRLHRLGNVTQEEIQAALSLYRFPDLQVTPDSVLLVQPHPAARSAAGGKQATATKQT